MLYNKLLEDIVLPIGDFVNQSRFGKELRYWRNVQNFSQAQLEELQREKLKGILTHTVKNIPYYKSKIDMGINDPQEWIRQFPIMRKKDIKREIDRFVFPAHQKKLISYESSGSSGIQGKVFMDKDEQSIIRAILILWWEWAGYKTGDPIVQTGMTPKRGVLKTIKDTLLRTYYLPAFGLNEDYILHHLKKIIRSKYNHLAGYASSLYLIAATAAKYRIEIRFESVISWGDKMFPQYRSVIEQTFHTSVFDTYACNEGLMIAAQRDLPYHYQMSPHTYVEIVTAEGAPVEDGTMGHVVVTRLDNYSMPLVRYYNGDLAIKLPRHKYPEKRKMNFPLLEKIIGRDTDIVRTRSGKFMIVHFFTGIFEFYPTIRQFRVIQRDGDSIQIEYIKEDGFENTTLDEIRSTIQKHLDERFVVDFIEVNTIPASPSGKPQIIVATIEDPLPAKT